MIYIYSFQAFCKMPERTTIVGNDFPATFDHCNASFCSEKPIQYSAPMPQLKLLLEKSPSCSQSIKFDCQLAQIMVSFFLRNICNLISVRLLNFKDGGS